MPPPTILCIDDEPNSLTVRCQMLERAGYRVIVAESPGEGVFLFCSENVDLVVLDYWMADMNGLAVASKLRKIKPNVAILMLSGFREISGEGLGLVNQWILKGESSPADLLNTVSELVAQPEGGNPAT